MGLDMWLRAKTKSREYKEGEGTGVCSGIFPIAPNDDGMVEIGYWRNGHDQDALISKYLEPGVPADGECSCRNIKVKKDKIDEILEEANNILSTHEFDEEDGYDLTDDCYGTWQCKRKWEDTIKFFTEAKKILEEDKDAEIYYCFWY